MLWHQVIELKAHTFSEDELRKVIDYEKWILNTRCENVLQVHSIGIGYDFADDFVQDRKKYKDRPIRLGRVLINSASPLPGPQPFASFRRTKSACRRADIEKPPGGMQRRAALKVQTPLDSVRRTGHQQFGSIEKTGPADDYSVIVRQHKHDFIVGLHGVVIIVLFFVDHNGALQIEAPQCIDPLLWPMPRRVPSGGPFWGLTVLVPLAHL